MRQYRNLWQVMKVSKITDFLTTHRGEIALIYVIGAMITFLVVFLFFRYTAKAEDEEKEVLRFDDTEELKKWMQNTVSFIIGLFCAIVWVFIPVVIFGAWMYYLITEKIPEMARLLKNNDRKETEE